MINRNRITILFSREYRNITARLLRGFLPDLFIYLIMSAKFSEAQRIDLGRKVMDYIYI